MAVKMKDISNIFIDLPIITYKEGKFWVSYVPFLYITGIGDTREESVKDLQDGIETYFHGEDVMKIIRKKLPIPKTPISLELLRFNIENNKIIPVTNNV